MFLNIIYRQMMSSHQIFVRLLSNSSLMPGLTVCTKIPLQSSVSSANLCRPLHSATTSHACLWTGLHQTGTSSLLTQTSTAIALHQPSRGKARGNEYQPSNRKRKTKHGFHKRMKTQGGIGTIWKRLLKGRRLLTH
nr:uncharacterized protein LOC129260287 [Lytechinus pictus]